MKEILLREHLIPRIDNIIAQYEEIIPLLQEIETLEDADDFEKEYHVTIEVNYGMIEKDNQVEVVRCEAWADLGYIYVYSDGEKPIFDVWSDLYDEYFIDGTTINKLEEEYIKGIKYMYNKGSKEQKFEIIAVLRQHGTDYNYMIDVYSFDSETVEEYEAEFYELGYGDTYITREVC